MKTKTLLCLLVVTVVMPMVGQPVYDSVRTSQPASPSIRYEAGLHIGPLVSFALNGFQMGQQPVGFMVKRVNRSRIALRLGYEFRGQRDLQGLGRYQTSNASDSVLLRSVSYRFMEHIGRVGMEYRVPLRKGICFTVGLDGLVGWNQERNQWWEYWGKRSADPVNYPDPPVQPLPLSGSLTEKDNRQGLFAGLGWSFGLWVPLGKRFCLSTQTRMDGYVQDLTSQKFERGSGNPSTSRAHVVNFTTRNLLSDVTLYYRW